MARGPRAISNSGYYHVMLRGAGRQLLFENDVDRRTFLRYLTEAIAGTKTSLIAWCLMDNHVHLLLCDPQNSLAGLMHSVSTRFALYFNGKSGHVGPVFQGRFKSKAIETNEYLLQAVRYIHDNPCELGVSRDSYQWSSYSEYVGDSRITDVAPVLELIGGKESFVGFSAAGRDDSYTPYESGRLSESEISRVLRRELKDRGIDVGAIKALHPTRRDQIFRRLHRCGLSVRQIERVTGVGRKAITRAVRQ
ncbi:transposase [Parolsenella catena]|uniref:transposase n=1 Tax=Parolsenella catena TaxID=2003188 RepID=UPI003078459A